MSRYSTIVETAQGNMTVDYGHDRGCGYFVQVWHRSDADDPMCEIDASMMATEYYGHSPKSPIVKTAEVIAMEFYNRMQNGTLAVEKMSANNTISGGEVINWLKEKKKI